MLLEIFKLFKTLKVYYLLEGCNVIARCRLKSCLSVWTTLFWIPAPASSEKMYIYLSVVVSNCLRSILLFFLHGPSPKINGWWCMEHWNHLCIISRLFFLHHLHRDGQPCVWGISFSLQSLITLYVIPIWILITALRECPFKHHVTPKSCYLHHVCHKDINANSCFLLPLTPVSIYREFFFQCLPSVKQKYLWVGRDILFFPP